MLFLPLPDFLEERIAPEIHARQLLLLIELALDDCLRRDACMVRTRHPQSGVAAHALVTNHDVLDRAVQRMPHVQHAGHIRRRDHDGEGALTGLLRTWGEATRGLPLTVGIGLEFSGRVARGELHSATTSTVRAHGVKHKTR